MLRMPIKLDDLGMKVPGIPAPSASTIRKNYAKYREHGTSLNMNKEHSGRPKTARSEQNVERVRRSLQRNGVVSSRRNGMNISRSSFSRIVKQDLRFYPYVLIERQELLPNDPEKRLEFCNWFINQSHNDAAFLSNLVTSDEAVFSLNSEVNKWNVVEYTRYGNGHPDDHYIGRKQGAGQVMVWLGLTGHGDISGPHFAENNLNTREHLRIIRYNVVQRYFVNKGIDRNAVWWQQDGAPAHTSNESMQYLRGQFPGKVISKRGDFLWPPRSPDLAILDFFVWGHLKHKIWTVPRNQKPRNIDELKRAIRRECEAIPRDMIFDTFHAMVDRYQRCISSNGHCFENE